MSDSDDTDILLLIPPDFFVAETNLEESLKYDLLDAKLFKPIKLSPKYETKPLIEAKPVAMAHDYQKSLTTTPSASCLKKQSTYDGLDTCHLMTVGGLRTPQGSRNNLHRNKTSENTAQQTEIGIKTPKGSNEDNFLKEIDSYLAGCSSHTSKLRDINAILQSNGITPLVFTESKRNTHLGSAHLGESSLARRAIETNDLICSDASRPDRMEGSHPISDGAAAVCRSLDAGRMSDWSLGLQQQNAMKHEEHLVNLNQIWENDQRDYQQFDSVSLNAQEEQLRRRQCERQIQGLQTQIKEYQEKFSVAIKIDQTKNEALARLHETNSSLVANISKLEQMLSDTELRVHREKDIFAENNDLQIKIQLLDKELLEAVRISKFLQDKNQMLEGKVNHLLQSTNDIRDLNRRQLEEMHIRLSNSKHSEDLLNNEILQLKNQVVTLQNKCDEYAVTQESLKKEKQRADTLDKQSRALQQKLDTAFSREKDMVKELEMQRLSLKAYYQGQLEEVVGEKLKEFQKQLDSVEETLKAEAKRNERLIAERAIKQIELLNQKNEQEFALLEEKNKQEIELYRIQLDNATKTISQMEVKLNAQRNDIAKRLHNVIESQWQQTLEIISNPQTESSKNSTKAKTFGLPKRNQNSNESIGVSGVGLHKVQNDIFETPSTFRKNKKNGSFS